MLEIIRVLTWPTLVSILGNSTVMHLEIITATVEFRYIRMRAPTLVFPPRHLWLRLTMVFMRAVIRRCRKTVCLL